MLRTVQILAGQPVLVTEYADQGQALTLVGVGKLVVYLGEDSGVTDANGSPLAPSQAIQWTGGPQIWAYSPTATTLLVTDAHTPPQQVNLSRASDSWNLPANTVTASNLPQTLPFTRDPAGADTSRGIYAAINLTLTAATGAGTNTLSGRVVASFSTGPVVVLASFSVNFAASSAASKMLLNTGQNAALPDGGGYTLQLVLDAYVGSTSTTIKAQGAAGAVLLIPAS